jgi:hypothetical protein
LIVELSILALELPQMAVMRAPHNHGPGGIGYATAERGIWGLGFKNRNKRQKKEDE